MSIEDYLKKCNCSTIDDLSNAEVLAFFKDEKPSHFYRKNEFGGLFVSSLYDATLFEQKRRRRSSGLFHRWFCRKIYRENMKKIAAHL